MRGDLLGRGLAVGAAQPLGQGARLQLVLLRPDRLQDVHGEEVAELGGPVQGQAPGHRGQEPRAERVPGPGRVQLLDLRDRRNENRLGASLLDLGSGGPEGRDPDADPVQDLRPGPAALALDEGFLVLVAEQVGRAVNERARLAGGQPGQLLGQVGRERDAQVLALLGVRQHGRGVAGADEDQVQAAGLLGERGQFDVPVLAHRPRIERGDLVAVGVGGADEPRGVLGGGLTDPPQSTPCWVSQVRSGAKSAPTAPISSGLSPRTGWTAGGCVESAARRAARFVAPPPPTATQIASFYPGGDERGRGHRTGRALRAGQQPGPGPHRRQRPRGHVPGTTQEWGDLGIPFAADLSQQLPRLASRRRCARSSTARPTCSATSTRKHHPSARAAGPGRRSWTGSASGSRPSGPPEPRSSRLAPSQFSLRACP